MPRGNEKLSGVNCGIVAGYGAGPAQQKVVRQSGRSLLACLVRPAASKVELPA